MRYSQQLFEINSRITQIKRSLQSRQQKVQQWSVPYEKILNNNTLLNNTKSQFHSRNNSFRKSFLDKNDIQFIQQELTNSVEFQSPTERKEYYEKKAKQSRKKINQYRNQLKQLQQLLERKTKLHVKKTEEIQRNSIAEIFNKTNYQSSSLSKNKNFASSAFFNKVTNNCTKIMNRTMKDRVNPFIGFKVEKAIELYQEVKQSGKQDLISSKLGVGLDFTPYSNLKKKNKKQQQIQQQQNQQVNPLLKFLSEIGKHKLNSARKQKLNSKSYKFNKMLPKVFSNKILNQPQIYLQSPRQKQNACNNQSILMNKKLNVFQLRMKNLIQQANNFQTYGYLYAKQQKRIMKRVNRIVTRNTNLKDSHCRQEKLNQFINQIL